MSSTSPAVASAYDFQQFILTYLSGGLAGGMGVCIGVPFDIVKVRMQTFPDLYKSGIQTFLSILKSEGVVNGIFKGSLVPILSVIPANALAFSGEDLYRNIIKKFVLKSPDEPLSNFHAFCGGTFGGIVQCLVLVPSEVIKCNMQIYNVQNVAENSSRLHKVGNYECFKNIFMKEGVRGIYKGTGVTIIREAPAYGVYFAGYRIFTDYFSEKVYDESSRTVKISNPPQWAVLVGGGFAGMLSWLVTYPFDVIKSNIQVEMGGGGADSDRSKLSTIGMGRHLLKTYGPGIFVRGLAPTLARAFPVNALTFYLNDLILNCFKN